MGGDGDGGLYNGDNSSGGAFALAQVGGGSLTLGNVTLRSNGIGGAGGAGGEGQSGGQGGVGSGGSVQAGDFDPDDIGDGNATTAYGALRLEANGLGGAGGSAGAGAAAGDGGDALGGAAYFNVRGDRLGVGTADLHQFDRRCRQCRWRCEQWLR